MNEKIELGKQIASFIVLSVAVSMPVVASQEDFDKELIADVPMVLPNTRDPNVVVSPVCRYAGPEYFGFSGKGTTFANPDVNSQHLPPVNDVAKYSQINNIPNTETGTMNGVTNHTLNINTVKPDANFINSEYGSVKVIEQSSHYIFK